MQPSLLFQPLSWRGNCARGRPRLHVPVAPRRATLRALLASLGAAQRVCYRIVTDEISLYNL
eukprot:3377578-Pleurochrysis_carterae.AAC.1